MKVDETEINPIVGSHYFLFQIGVYNKNLILCTEPDPKVFNVQYEAMISDLLKAAGRKPTYIASVLSRLKNHLEKYNSPAYAGVTSQLGTENDGFTATYFIYLPIKNYLCDPRVVSALTHELYHVARKIIAQVGVEEPKLSAGEATAYLLGYLTRVVWGNLVEADYPFKKD